MSNSVTVTIPDPINITVSPAEINVSVASSGVQGIQGPQGDKGDIGDAGPAGQGVPTGGTAGQALIKTDATDYNTEWAEVTGKFVDGNNANDAVYTLGNVGIGTTAPAASLEILNGDIRVGHSSNILTGIDFFRNGARNGRIDTDNNQLAIRIGLGKSLLFKDSSRVNLACMSEAGDFGIGTSNADKRLHVEQDSSETAAVSNVFRMTSTNDGTGTIAAGIGVGMEFEVETATDNNEVIAAIEAETTNVGSGTEAGDLVFKTMTGGASADEAMRITGDNNFGFGTAPDSAYRLSIGEGDWNIDDTNIYIYVKGDRSWRITRNYFSSDANQAAKMASLRPTLTLPAFMPRGDDLDSGIGGTGNNLSFIVGSTSRMYFDGDGNVGIGTTSPDTKLHNTGAYTQQSLSSDPADPDVGNSVQWVSDGTDSGDAGDVMIKINVGGVVKIATLVDYSAI